MSSDAERELARKLLERDLEAARQEVRDWEERSDEAADKLSYWQRQVGEIATKLDALAATPEGSQHE